MCQYLISYPTVLWWLLFPFHPHFLPVQQLMSCCAEHRCAFFNISHSLLLTHTIQFRCKSNDFRWNHHRTFINAAVQFFKSIFKPIQRFMNLIQSLSLFFSLPSHCIFVLSYRKIHFYYSIRSDKKLNEEISQSRWENKKKQNTQSKSSFSSGFNLVYLLLSNLCEIFVCKIHVPTSL